MNLPKSMHLGTSSFYKSAPVGHFELYKGIMRFPAHGTGTKVNCIDIDNTVITKDLTFYTQRRVMILYRMFHGHHSLHAALQGVPSDKGRA
jgi:hypothetical protein